MTTTWRDAMNADIKAFFDLDESADVIDIDTGSEDRGPGCNSCRWTVFVVEVTFRVDGSTRTEKFEGNMSAFLTAVSEAAEPNRGTDDVADTVLVSEDQDYFDEDAEWRGWGWARSR